MSACPTPTVEDCQLLTPAQETVICLISAGSTIVAAAEAAGVHRNTILNWRRNSANFRLALRLASEEKALFWRDQTKQLAAAAIEALRSILADPKAPASVRLKAALHVLGTTCASPIFTEEDEVARTIGAAEDPLTFQYMEMTRNVQNRAQSAQPQQPQTPVLTLPVPKVGRNDYCPCGSGKKYKRCCIDKDSRALGGGTTEPAQFAGASVLINVTNQNRFIPS